MSGALDALLDVVDEEVGDLVGVARDQRHRQVLVGVDAGAGDDLDAGLLRDALHQADVAAQVHARRLDDGLHAALDGRGHELGGDVLGAFRGHAVERVLADGAHLRELDEDRLVARHEVLVDERFAELGSVDRTCDRLYLRPSGRILSKQLDRGDHHRRQKAGDQDGHRDDPAARHRRLVWRRKSGCLKKGLSCSSGSWSELTGRRRRQLAVAHATELAKAHGAALEIVSAYEPVPSDRLREEKDPGPGRRRVRRRSARRREREPRQRSREGARGRDRGEHASARGRSGRRDPRRRRGDRGRSRRGRQQGDDRAPSASCSGACRTRSPTTRRAASTSFARRSAATWTRASPSATRS